MLFHSYCLTACVGSVQAEVKKREKLKQKRGQLTWILWGLVLLNEFNLPTHTHTQRRRIVIKNIIDTSVKCQKVPFLHELYVCCKRLARTWNEKREKWKELITVFKHSTGVDWKCLEKLCFNEFQAERRTRQIGFHASM